MLQASGAGLTAPGPTESCPARWQQEARASRGHRFLRPQRTPLDAHQRRRLRPCHRRGRREARRGWRHCLDASTGQRAASL